MSTRGVVVTLLLGLLGPSLLSGAGTPGRFAVTNLTADNASIVWLSADIETGRVEFARSVADLTALTGTFATATDNTGASRVHHVTLGEAALFDNLTSSGRPPLRSDDASTRNILLQAASWPSRATGKCVSENGCRRI